MSTRAAIGMLMPDWTIKAIYLHQDGCPFESGAGGVLAQHYTTTERVEMLLALGDLSSLGAKIFPDAKTPHSWANPQPDVTVAFHRDRGDDYNPPVVFSDLYEYETKSSEVFGAEFLYLFVDDQWIVCDLYDTPREWEELEDILQG